MINSTIHLRICLSIHQRDCLFSLHQATSSSSPSLHCILLLIEFPRWNFIPDATLFASSLFLFRFFPYCIKSRNHFTAILSRQLSLGSTHPFRSLLVYICTLVSSQTIVPSYTCVGLFWVQCSRTKSRRDTSFSKWMESSMCNNSHFT